FPAPITGNLAPTISASALEAALNALLASAVGIPALGAGAGTVSVGTIASANGTTFLLTFGGSLAGRSVPLLIDTDSSNAGDDVLTAVVYTGMVGFCLEVAMGGRDDCTPTL